MNRAILFFVVSTTLILPSLDATAAIPPDVVFREASQRYEEGVRLYDGGKYEEARLKFAEACTVFRAPNALLGLARAEQGSGHLLEAAMHFREYLQHPKIPADREKQARDGLADVQTKVGRIRVRTVAKSARVTLDGHDLLDASEPIEVMPGRHSVALTDHQDDVRNVEVAAGQIVEISLLGEKKSTRDSGNHQRKHDPVKPSEDQTLRLVVSAGLAGGTILAAVGGAVFSNTAASERDRATGFASQVQSGCLGVSAGPCAGLRDARSAQSSAATISDVLFVGAGVMAVGALVSWFVLRKPAVTGGRSGWVAPVVSGSGGGFQVGSSF